MQPLKFYGLFEGIGGFSVAAERAGFEIVGLCDNDKFSQKVLSHHYPNVPIHSDIFDLDGKPFRNCIDIVSAGFPCQPFSIAGERKGVDDKRFLFPQVLRFLEESKPAWFVGENVIGLSTLSQPQSEFDVECETYQTIQNDYVLPQIIEGLQAIGYEVQTFSIGAIAVGYNHIRQRVWILANLCGERCKTNDVQTFVNFERCSSEGSGRIQQHFTGRFLNSLFEVSKRDLLNKDVGISEKSFEFLATKALGNSVCPDIPTILFEYINSVEKMLKMA